MGPCAVPPRGRRPSIAGTEAAPAAYCTRAHFEQLLAEVVSRLSHSREVLASCASWSLPLTQFPSICARPALREFSRIRRSSSTRATRETTRRTAASTRNGRRRRSRGATCRVARLRLPVQFDQLIPSLHESGVIRRQESRKPYRKVGLGRELENADVRVHELIQ